MFLQAKKKKKNTRKSKFSFILKEFLSSFLVNAVGYNVIWMNNRKKTLFSFGKKVLPKWFSVIDDHHHYFINIEIIFYLIMNNNYYYWGSLPLCWCDGWMENVISSSSLFSRIQQKKNFLSFSFITTKLSHKLSLLLSLFINQLAH